MAAKENLVFYQHLFNETLFVFPERRPKSAAVPAPISAADLALGDLPPLKKYNLVGTNRKGLVLVFTLPEPEFKALPQNGFLSKILAAIKLNPEDVAYLNMPPRERLDVARLTKETTVSNLLVFGPGLLDMSADSKVSLYKPASIGHLPLLIVEPLADIELDVNKKKSLWNSLQAIFLK